MNRRTQIAALIIAVSLPVAGWLGVEAWPQAPRPDRGSVMTEAVADTYVTSSDPGASRGAEWRIRAGSAGGERQGLVKFSVSGVPASACGIRAVLRMWSRTNDGPDDVTSVHHVDPNTWTEAITWQNRPTFGPEVARFDQARANDWTEAEVPITGNGVFAFGFTHRGSTLSEFATREDTTAAHAPQLRIDYSLGDYDFRNAPACGGAWWGIYKSGNADISPYENGRTFGAFRRYYSLSQVDGDSLSWPSAEDAQLARGGRVLFLQMETRCYGACPRTFAGVALPEPVNVQSPPAPVDASGESYHPDDVAAGKIDVLLVAAAKRLKAFPGRVVLDVTSEIDTQVEWMTDRAERDRWISGYKRMLRHVHDLFRAQGVTNVAWNYVVGGFSDDDGIYTGSYPGDSYVDWISWDPYDKDCAKGGAYETLNRFYSRLENGLLGPGARQKAYGILEFGFGGDCQPAYFRDLAQAVGKLPKIRALIYFDRPGTEYGLTDAGTRAFDEAGMADYVRRPRGR